jgi:hypothetical protein
MGHFATEPIFTIDDIDLLQVRQVHKDALARRLQLEGFWMRIELVVFLKPLVRSRVNCCDSRIQTIAMANVDSLP